MALTPEDLINKSFKAATGSNGYDMDDVDAFLDELVIDLRKLYEENDALKRKLEAAEQKAAEAPVASSAPAASEAAPAANDAAGLLAMAQKVHDDYVHQGETTKANLIAEGEKKAADLVSEATEKRDSVLAKLTDERDSLEVTIESLRGFEERYRAKLKDHLNAQLDELASLRSIEKDAQ
ncbi:MAG: DivIVA domain-containing protein [Rothia sp. (in: high G+C Gram-positive bacteria)]|uniref:DivIVA domain-containing protein n=1 Tax=Rothia sp. (in: high G+C Gram-positive bacteria) TaxID=1885016 RepID=UPI0026DF4692|nr:DivIVA domain-containing protein [Rothia sp. (in: high G+C Gram-positive bacteria)]MDO5751109.1 DivIVA domain-containing protein [Rothia sp. (in: high G+C Gram-positive bacteria)]